MRPVERRLELLIGQRVVDVNGATVGRLEEVVTEYVGDEYVVREFHVGAFAVFERLGSGLLGNGLLRLLGGNRIYDGYVVPWREMDLGDPDHLRVTVEKAALRRIEEAEHPSSSVRRTGPTRPRRSA